MAVHSNFFCVTIIAREHWIEMPLEVDIFTKNVGGLTVAIMSLGTFWLEWPTTEKLHFHGEAE